MRAGGSDPAWAVPAPMSRAELVAASDLVALVRVLSVTCIGIVHHAGQELRIYSAELGVLKVNKGPVGRYDIVSVRWEETPSDVLGPWYVPYYPGGKAWTHLVWHDGIYDTTWWNGAEWLRRGQLGLPQGVMETVNGAHMVRWTFFAVRRLRSLIYDVFGSPPARCISEMTVERMVPIDRNAP